MSETRPLLKFQPINLFSAPARGCNHSHWMMLYSLKKRICYDCGKVEVITNDMPIHTR